MKKGIKACTVAILLFTFCFCSICLSALLPNKPIQRHVLDSCEQLSDEGLYPKFFGFKLFQMDNYTDTIMLFESVSIDETAPVQSIMSNKMYKSEDYFSLVEDLSNYLQGNMNDLEEIEYSRYWHGYLIILRPLLEFFNYQQIRVLNYIIFLALFFVLSVCIWKNIGKRECVIFLVSQITVSLPLIPYNLQFSWTFYIAYIASLLIIRREKCCTNSEYFIYMFFFVVGGLTSFIDLLVTPIITVGLPLIFLLSMRNHEMVQKKVVRIMGVSVAWSIGFAFIWGAKWIVGSWITGSDVVSDAMNQMFIRTTGSTWKGMELTVSNIVNFLFATLQAHHILIPLIIFVVVALTAYVLCVKNTKTIIENSWLLIIACMPLVWCFVLREHSIQHGWFTWRMLVISLFAGILFIWNTCDVKVGIGKIKRR